MNEIENNKDIFTSTCENLKCFVGNKKYKTVYADPPWQFSNRTGKVAPENKKLLRYSTMTLERRRT